MVSLNPLVVGHIASLANLEELNLGVKYHHVELYNAFKQGTLKSWNKVHTLGLTIRRVITNGYPGFNATEIVKVISTLVPNVKHLSLSFTNYYDNHPFKIVNEYKIFVQMPDAFTELLSFKINHGSFLFYEGVRNEPGEPFVTTMTRKAQIMLARHMQAPWKPRDPILDEYEAEEVDEESEDEEEEGHKVEEKDEEDEEEDVEEKEEEDNNQVVEEEVEQMEKEDQQKEEDEDDDDDNHKEKVEGQIEEEVEEAEE